MCGEDVSVLSEGFWGRGGYCAEGEDQGCGGWSFAGEFYGEFGGGEGTGEGGLLLSDGLGTLGSGCWVQNLPLGHDFSRHMVARHGRKRWIRCAFTLLVFGQTHWARLENLRVAAFGLGEWQTHTRCLHTAARPCRMIVCILASLNFGK